MATQAEAGRRLSSRVLRTAGLVRVLAPRELRVRYRQSLLTVAWAVITPVVVLAVYGLVLTRSFGVAGSCAPYVTTAWTGLVLWTFFATALGGAVGSLVQSSDLITKLYFPRESLPLATVAASLPDLAVGMVSAIVVAYVQGVRPGAAAFVIVLPLLVLVVWTAALSIIAAMVAAFTRDAIHGVHLALRVGFFATPVMYEANLVPEAFRWTADWNPVAVAVSATRSAFLCSEIPDLGLVGVHLAASIAVLVGAVLYTRTIEARIVDVI